MRHTMTRLHLIWNIIRGRPTMYRVTIHQGSPMIDSTENMGGWFVENTFIGTGEPGSVAVRLTVPHDGGLRLG